MAVLNLGIVAHVDAGKTSLTERLLYAAGVIDELGSVDAGSTRTDSLALERQRGITIKAAVVSFEIGGRTVNLIDTPGHPDFIAEVERALGVLDGAVLVISAVEGVQAQTRVLLRVLRRLGIPTLIFVNKVDRRGAQEAALLRRIAGTLTPDVLPMVTVDELGAAAARVRPLDVADPAFRTRMADLLTRYDDELLAEYVATGMLPDDRLRAALARQTRQARVHPVFFGSAVTGAGLEPLVTGLVELLPAATEDAGPPSGTVFKIERASAGERIAYVRMFAGTLHTRDTLDFHRGGGGRITAINVFERGSAEVREAVAAGRIGQLRGLVDVRIGDTFGVPSNADGNGDGRFAPPTLETVVLPRQPADRGALHLALTQLAEQDPLIDLRRDELRQEIAVSLYGEVQKEVIAATLATDFGVEVEFRETTTICLERPVGRGAAVELIGTDSNPFLATVGLRIEPGPVDSGVRFRLEVELGSMPRAFFVAVEETVHAALAQGLHGWRVTDCVVTMTHSGYWPRQSHAHATFDKSMSSTAGDFRNLTPLVLLGALRRAGSAVFEPVHRFRLEAPAGTAGAIVRALAGLGMVPQTTVTECASDVLTGYLPAAVVHRARQPLPALTSGEGILETTFDHHQPVIGAIPTRARTDHNPLYRKEYLLHVQRRA
ncbi:MAG TPA: translation factor GTPase family protein [Pseudonocardia sp.]|nr:translation factor GTPase family protein [Pseudonocardia sp.]